MSNTETLTNDFKYVLDTLAILEKHWQREFPGAHFKLELYSNEDFSVGCFVVDAKNEDETKRYKEHSFYANRGIGELIAYCKHMREHPNEAYADR